VRDAAQRLGLSERGVLKRIHARTLTAERDGKRWIVYLPSEPSSGLGSEPIRTANRTSSEPVEPIEADYRVAPAARQQLEAIRDEWLAPLVAQITEQAEALGRLEAERDQARQSAEAAIAARDQMQEERDELLTLRETLRVRLSRLEAQHAASLTQASSASQTATGEATTVPWWQFWKRS